MKLIVIMSIEEHAERLRKLLTENRVLVFSELTMKGFKRFPAPDSRDDWFTRGRSETYSHLVFTVTEKKRADELMDVIRKESASDQSSNPIHAFVANVEEFI